MIAFDNEVSKHQHSKVVPDVSQIFVINITMTILYTEILLTPIYYISTTYLLLLPKVANILGTYLIL